MTKEKSKLPRPAKVAASKALRELEFTQQQIADILGIGKRSVERYLKEETPENWRVFGENIKKLVAIKEEEIAAKALAQIEQKMPKAKFYELVGLYKTIRELQQPQKTSINVADKMIIFQVVKKGGEENEEKGENI